MKKKPYEKQLRSRFLNWFFDLCKLKPQEILPWWGVVIATICYPSRICWMLAGLVYDPIHDFIKVGGTTWCLRDMEYVIKKRGNFWFRFYQDESGHVLMETREFKEDTDEQSN